MAPFLHIFLSANLSRCPVFTRLGNVAIIRHVTRPTNLIGRQENYQGYLKIEQAEGGPRGKKTERRITERY